MSPAWTEWGYIWIKGPKPSSSNLKNPDEVVLRYAWRPYLNHHPREVKRSHCETLGTLRVTWVRTRRRSIIRKSSSISRSSGILMRRRWEDWRRGSGHELQSHRRDEWIEPKLLWSNQNNVEKYGTILHSFSRLFSAWLGYRRKTFRSFRIVCFK